MLAAMLSEPNAARRALTSSRADLGCKPGTPKARAAPPRGLRVGFWVPTITGRNLPAAPYLPAPHLADLRHPKPHAKRRRKAGSRAAARSACDRGWMNKLDDTNAFSRARDARRTDQTGWRALPRGRCEVRLGTLPTRGSRHGRPLALERVRCARLARCRVRRRAFTVPWMPSCSTSGRPARRAAGQSSAPSGRRRPSTGTAALGRREVGGTLQAKFVRSPELCITALIAASVPA